MFIGKVIGNVWATKKEDNLTGLKFMIVRKIDVNGNESKEEIVAVDRIGSGIGDQVIVTCGTPATNFNKEKLLTIDALIIGIIDSIEIG